MSSESKLTIQKIKENVLIRAESCNFENEKVEIKKEIKNKKESKINENENCIGCGNYVLFEKIIINCKNCFSRDVNFQNQFSNLQ